jgi:hypothetical protein
MINLRKKHDTPKKRKANEEEKTPREGKEKAVKPQASQLPISISKKINSIKSTSTNPDKLEELCMNVS